jgi:uncharacterized protein
VLKTISQSLAGCTAVFELLAFSYSEIRNWQEMTPKALACYLLGIESAQQLSRDKMRGLLFANLVVIEALKARLNSGKESNLYFYRDSHQNEVDLLLKQGNDFSAIEIESAQTFYSDLRKDLKFSVQS